MDFTLRRLRTRRALSIFNDVQLRAKRRYQYSTMFSWEPEGRYQYSTMFSWEPEGRYRHWLCTEIASFWFSGEYSWKVITPFWPSIDDYVEFDPLQFLRRTVGQGEPKTGQKQKYRFTKKLYFYGLNRKIIILDIMCLNLFEWKIIISTLKITSKSNLWINYIETSKMTIPRFVNF